MRKFITLCLSLSLLALVAVASSASNNAPDPQVASQPAAGPTDAVYLLIFNGPTDTFTFNVEKAQKAGNLTVATADCCIPGDFWKADLTPAQPANKNATGLGDGTADVFTGPATVAPWVRGTVTVSYDHGVDVFPAGMWVKFSYSQASNNNTGMVITPQF